MSKLEFQETKVKIKTFKDLENSLPCVTKYCLLEVDDTRKLIDVMLSLFGRDFCSKRKILFLLLSLLPKLGALSDSLKRVEVSEESVGALLYLSRKIERVSQRSVRLLGQLNVFFDEVARAAFEKILKVFDLIKVGVLLKCSTNCDFVAHEFKNLISLKVFYLSIRSDRLILFNP